MNCIIFGDNNYNNAVQYTYCDMLFNEKS